MNERTDHAAEALKILDAENTPAEYRLGWETADAQHLAARMEAQTHATLALVEQQRISNLIALGTSAVRQVAEGTATKEEYLAFYNRTNPLIREGLGI